MHRISNNLSVVKTASVYFVVVSSLLVLYPFVADLWVMDSYLNLNATLTAFVLNLSWVDVATESSVVSSGSFGMKIIPECTPLLPAAILVSGVIAFPCSRTHKLIGVVGGILALSVINIVRTTSLFYIGMWAPAQFDTAHLLVWQSLMILSTVAIWVVWYKSRRYVPH
jgi:exosortase H (IPTLxxWG-CTERM-specific)